MRTADIRGRRGHYIDQHLHSNRFPDKSHVATVSNRGSVQFFGTAFSVPETDVGRRWRTHADTRDAKTAKAGPIWHPLVKAWRTGAVPTVRLLARSHGLRPMNRQGDGRPIAPPTPTLNINSIKIRITIADTQPVECWPACGLNETDHGPTVSDPSCAISLRPRTALGGWLHCGAGGLSLERSVLLGGPDGSPAVAMEMRVVAAMTAAGTQPAPAERGADRRPAAGRVLAGGVTPLDFGRAPRRSQRWVRRLALRKDVGGLAKPR